METTQSFATRCAAWLGTITPEIREIEGSIVGRTAPGPVVATAQHGALWLFATGYPTTDADGAESYTSAEIWICDGVEGDVAPILSLIPVRP